MSYAVQSPPVAVSPAGPRPGAVTAAVALLWAMAAGGMTYAAGMLAVTPGVVARFRDAVSGSDAADNFVTLIWLVAALAPVLSLVFLGLLVVLGIALRRGSRPARAIALGVCGVGMVTGLGTLGILAAQRAGDAAPDSLSEALNGAYPNGWIVLNVAVAVAQVLAYLVVGVLLLAAPKEFFGFVAPREFTSAPQWAVPQTSPFVTGRSEPDQFSDPVVAPKSASNPEDEYWSRPNE